MAIYIRRREFLSTLFGVAVAWPLAARAQQAMPMIGFLSARSPQDTTHLVEAFRQGLREAGFVEGRNVMIEYRWALGQHDRLPELAAELVRKPLAVLVSTGGEVAALAAQAATSTIPIVFIVGTDPVKLGLAASYNRPGGNATGINIMTNSLEPKRLELLRELVPQASIIGALFDPSFMAYENQLRDVSEAARTLHQQVQELRASTDAEIDRAFETVTQQHIAAVTSPPDLFLIRGATSLWPWRHATWCRRCTISANFLWPGGSSATASMRASPIAKSEFTPAGSSRVKSRQNCPFFSRPGSSLSSISRPRRRSA
jgi:putative ABC transport system substrate-binding protein